MAIIRVRRDEKTNEIYIETSLKGKPLLTIPQINKGTAYTEEERWEFDLIGKLPYSIETIEQQEVRSYKQFSRFNTDLEKHIYVSYVYIYNNTILNIAYDLCYNFCCLVIQLYRCSIPI